MIRQPEFGNRNKNVLFYEMERKQIEKINKILAGTDLTRSEEKTLLWLAGWEEGQVDNLLSVIEKTARIRAQELGGYAHKKEGGRNGDNCR